MNGLSRKICRPQGVLDLLFSAYWVSFAVVACYGLIAGGLGEPQRVHNPNPLVLFTMLCVIFYIALGLLLFFVSLDHAFKNTSQLLNRLWWILLMFGLPFVTVPLYYFWRLRKCWFPRALNAGE